MAIRVGPPGSPPTTSSSPTTSTPPPWSCSPRPPGRGGRSDRAGEGAVLTIGLTGNIGAGKSSVAELLVSHGAHLIDADKVAREV
ncbi:MAG TPA: dephospho-CoA kinase, partial [Acidimicrobiales bacterium]